MRVRDEYLPLFNRLYPRGEPGRAEIRAINKDTGKVTQRFYGLTRHRMVADDVERLRDTHHVFLSMLPRDGEEGTREACMPGRAVWVDLDTPQAPLELLSFSLEPSLVVASGSAGCHHAYWFLRDPAAPDEIERINRRLAARLGADPKCCDAARVMRLPGTLNHKHDPPEPVRVVERNSRRPHGYSVEEIWQALEDDDPPVLAIAQPRPGGTPPTCRAVQLVLDRVKGALPSGGGWRACCPAHDDQVPSLSIDEGEDGRCLLRCHAGCSFQQIVEALGLDPAELFDDDHGTGRASTIQRMVTMIEAHGVELFHDQRQRPFALFEVNGHREVWPITSGGFRRWLRLWYYQAYTQAPSPDQLRAAGDLFLAQAEFEGPEREVHRRVGGDLERLVIDIGDASWRAIEITADGWTIVERPPLLFQREAGALPLPDPVTGGSLDLLRPFTNISEPEDWFRLRGGLIGAFHPTGPYLVTVFVGQEGSTKSYAARRIAGLIDPFEPQAIVGTPNPRDLLVAASRARLTVVDNVSTLSRGLSDMLAVISTGAGDRRRALYSDDDLFAIVAKGPTLLTCLTQIARQPDVISRGNFVHFARMANEQRRREADLDAKFAELRGALLGAVLDALVAALRYDHDVQLPQLPRMADVAAFVTAAEHGIPGAQIGSFLAALEAAQQDARSRAAEASPFTEGVLKLMQEVAEWQGTASQLLQLIAQRPDVDDRARAFPRHASHASQLLDEHRATLQDHGISFKRDRDNGGSRTRTIRLTRALTRDEGQTGTDGRGGAGR